MTPKQPNSNFYKTVLIIVVLLLILDAGLLYLYFQYNDGSDLDGPFTYPDSMSPTIQAGFEKFTSDKDFKEYIALASEISTNTSFFPKIGLGQRDVMFEEMPMMDIGLSETAAPAANGIGGGAEIPSRVSETNVQVTGIDEPDIVKTDGQEIYFSSRSYYRGGPIILEESIIDIDTEPGIPTERSIAPQQIGGTKNIKAFPPADLNLDATIEEVGTLLLSNDILIVFSDTNDKIIGYDVSDPANPVEKWDIKLTERNYLETARLYNDKIYFITRTNIDTRTPCPLKPLTFNDQELTISCNEIYHPKTAIPVDTTYAVIIMDPQTGDIVNKTSFIGSLGQSVIYMSAESIFVTYTYPGDFIAYVYNFFIENKDIVPEWVIDKMAKLQSYDLSDQAKMTEFSSVMEKFINSLTGDEALVFENELENRLDDYSKDHKRELEQSGIVKIKVSDLSVTAAGSVPGHPLNQFSLDEYKGNLRIATTIGGQRGFSRSFGFGSESENDVYVLDKNLKITGSVLGMGLTERIYSARFIEDKAYIVTFRQTDPFYVLDLSNPKNPQLKGELKIPGYSSYLHPISKDKILGIGKESSNVKLSLFDVSDPTNPTEADKYQLKEYWSDILDTHHAFLLDDKYNVFFLPGGQGGYIFSYADDKLSLETAISDIRARRAVFIDDYLYIIGDDKIVILNEKDWQRINELEYK